MNQLPFLDSDSFTNPQSSELEAFLKCVKDADGENAQKVYRFLLIAPFPNCAINLPNIEVTLVSDVIDEKCCLDGVAFDAVLYIGDNITFSDSVINNLKKICTNNAQHTPLVVACQIEKSEWLRLSKEFVCVDHIRYQKKLIFRLT